MAENFRVGQILYIIPADNATVVPVQVMERRTSETASGVATKHIVKTPKPQTKPLVLETVKGMIFADLNQARQVMLQNATSAIDGMIRHASAVAQQVFAPQPKPQQRQQQEAEDDPFDVSDVLIDDDQGVPQNGAGPHALPARIEQPTMAPEADEPMAEVMLPDGRKQRVRLKMNV